MNKQDIIGIGRRKTAVAAVRLKKGSGQVFVNKRKIEEYFSTKEQKDIILAPLRKLDLESGYDLIVRVKGGGLDAQSIAVRLGLSRALVKEDEERRQFLKSEGYLTRDSRKKERKKYGLAGARKRFQFSKR